jgi:nitrite reductase (NADH) large subunit
MTLGPDPELEFELCNCTGVRRAEVLAALAGGARSVGELRAVTGVCSGCRTCACELEALLRQVRVGEAACATPKAPPAPIRGVGTRDAH